MNEHDMEERLRRLRPAPPSNDLMVRLQLARPAAPARRTDWRVWLLRAALSAAAAWAIVLVAAHRSAPAPVQVAAEPSRAAYEAVVARDFILAAEPLGVGHDEAGRPFRVVRTYGVRREVWKNSADGTEVASVVPQQHLLLARMDVY
jgi:hypothetical protein